MTTDFDSSARFDLHAHSTASDGVFAPRDVVALALDRGLAGIALTDHDTVAGIAEAVDAANALGLTCIPGVELSCHLPDGREIHLLGYFVDIEHPPLLALLERMRQGRIERARAVCERLASLDVKLTLDDIVAESPGGVPGRPHIAKALVRVGAVSSVDEAFTDRWIAPGGRAYVERQSLGLREAIDAIHDAGGLAVMAHPGSRKRGGVSVPAIREAVELGLDGLEVDHPDHEDETVRQCSQLAAELNLIPTSGSDDHGSGPRGSRLGCRTVPGSTIERMRDRVRARTTS